MLYWTMEASFLSYARLIAAGIINELFDRGYYWEPACKSRYIRKIYHEI